MSIPTSKPRIVYKYLDSIGGRLALHESTIKYTSILHFNDPFECRFGDFSPDDVKRFVEDFEIAKTDRDQWKAFCNAHADFIPAGSSERELMRHQTTEQLLQYVKSFSLQAQPFVHSGVAKTLAIASFSERKDSLLMWSHYAQQHKGLVIGYDTNCFHSILPDGDSLSPVSYVDKRVAMPLSSDVPWGTLDQLTTTKFHDWSYEHEWRSVVVDHEERMDEYGSIYAKIDPHYICEINIGACATNELISVCGDYCSNHPNCKLYQASFDRREYSLNFSLISPPPKLS